MGGRTDYVQVDTNSEVENGKGLLLTLGPDLSRQAVLALPMPRDVQLRALRLLPDGDAVLAGTRDGPLTHTESSMTHNDGFWGIAHIGGNSAFDERQGLLAAVLLVLEAAPRLCIAVDAV